MDSHDQSSDPWHSARCSTRIRRTLQRFQTLRQRWWPHSSFVCPRHGCVLSCSERLSGTVSMIWHDMNTWLLQKSRDGDKTNSHRQIGKPTTLPWSCSHPIRFLYVFVAFGTAGWRLWSQPQIPSRKWGTSKIKGSSSSYHHCLRWSIHFQYWGAPTLVFRETTYWWVVSSRIPFINDS